MSVDENPDEATEKIKILATDDEKIKSFGENSLPMTLAVKFFNYCSMKNLLQLKFLKKQRFPSTCKVPLEQTSRFRCCKNFKD